MFLNPWEPNYDPEKRTLTFSGSYTSGGMVLDTDKILAITGYMPGPKEFARFRKATWYHLKQRFGRKS